MKLFRKLFETEFERNLPPHTREWLYGRPLWHDSDLFIAVVLGFVVGIVIGLSI